MTTKLIMRYLITSYLLGQQKWSGARLVGQHVRAQIYFLFYLFLQISKTSQSDVYKDSVLVYQDDGNKIFLCPGNFIGQ